MQNKTKKKSRGLGDTLAKVTHFLFLDRFVDWFAVKILKKEDCGCERRRSKLNELFPYKKKNDDNDSEDIFDSEYFI